MRISGLWPFIRCVNSSHKEHCVIFVNIQFWLQLWEFESVSRADDKWPDIIPPSVHISEPSDGDNSCKYHIYGKRKQYQLFKTVINGSNEEEKKHYWKKKILSNSNNRGLEMGVNHHCIKPSLLPLDTWPCPLLLSMCIIYYWIKIEFLFFNIMFKIFISNTNTICKILTSVK